MDIIEGVIIGLIIAFILAIIRYMYKIFAFILTKKYGNTGQLGLLMTTHSEEEIKDELGKLEKKKAEQKVLLEKHKNNLLIIYDELLVYFNLVEELRNRKSNISSELPIYKQKFAQYLPQLLLELYNPIDSKFYNKLFIFLGILNEDQNEFNMPFNSPKETYKYLHQIIQEINNNEYDHSIIKFIQNNNL